LRFNTKYRIVQTLDPSTNARKVSTLLHPEAVVQFAVAALYERRNLMNQKAEVIDRRYKKPNHTTTCT
jgi:hypothetical protein